MTALAYQSKATQCGGWSPPPCCALTCTAVPVLLPGVFAAPMVTSLPCASSCVPLTTAQRTRPWLAPGGVAAPLSALAHCESTTTSTSCSGGALLLVITHAPMRTHIHRHQQGHTRLAHAIRCCVQQAPWNLPAVAAASKRSAPRAASAKTAPPPANRTMLPVVLATSASMGNIKAAWMWQLYTSALGCLPESTGGDGTAPPDRKRQRTLASMFQPKPVLSASASASAEAPVATSGTGEGAGRRRKRGREGNDDEGRAAGTGEAGASESVSKLLPPPGERSGPNELPPVVLCYPSNRTMWEGTCGAAGIMRGPNYSEAAILHKALFDAIPRAVHESRMKRGGRCLLCALNTQIVQVVGSRRVPASLLMAGRLIGDSCRGAFGHQLPDFHAKILLCAVPTECSKAASRRMQGWL